MKGHQCQWLAGWLLPGNRTFLEVASMVVITVTICQMYENNCSYIKYIRKEGKNAKFMQKILKPVLDVLSPQQLGTSIIPLYMTG